MSNENHGVRQGPTHLLGTICDDCAQAMLLLITFRVDAEKSVGTKQIRILQCPECKTVGVYDSENNEFTQASR